MLEVQIKLAMIGLVHEVEVQWVHAAAVCVVLAVICYVNRARISNRKF